MKKVWLDHHAREAIAAEATQRRFRETGGPLFGYGADGGVVIVRAIGPGPKAKHRRTRLIPDQEATQRGIEEIFKESDGKLAYLGDWHTHPLGHAVPSGTDVEGAEGIARDADVDLTSPVVLIQSTSPLRRHVRVRELGAYIWDGGTLDPAELIAADLQSAA